MRAPASGRRRLSRRRRGPPKIRREPACWEPLGRSRRRPTQTSPSDRSASRAPHGPAPASAQASRLTDDPERTRSSSASPFGAPEGVNPPRVPYRQTPTHPISHTVLNRAKRQGIAAIEARNSANPPAVFSRPRACNRVSRFSVRTRSRANPESQSAPQTTRLRPRTTPIERRLRPRAPSKRGNKSQSCHSAPASWHDTRPRVKKFGTTKFELESVMGRRPIT